MARTVVAVVVLLILAVFLVRHYHNHDIKTVIRQIEDLLEAENLSGCMAYIAVDYSDSHDHDRADLEFIGADFFRTVEGLNLTIVNLDIERRDNYATVTMQFKLVGTFKGYRGYLLGGIADVSRAELRMVNRDGRWHILEIENQELGSQPGRRS
ncbi:hypothetical protein JW905_03250 [bacterium]|nr:hypothetical protein [candidate division CSSED10-310 bacterium]